LLVQVALYHLLPSDWSVLTLLDTVATSQEPVYNALIDVGALVTGMSNLEVGTAVSCCSLLKLNVMCTGSGT
jgi:hypothetical protein